MDAVNDIFSAFGSPKAIADAVGLPIQTVCDWRKKGRPEIPPWRRPAVLQAAKRKKVMLPDHCISYLRSTERNIGASQADAA